MGKTGRQRYQLGGRYQLSSVVVPPPVGTVIEIIDHGNLIFKGKSYAPNSAAKVGTYWTVIEPSEMDDPTRHQHYEGISVALRSDTVGVKIWLAGDTTFAVRSFPTGEYMTLVSATPPTTTTYEGEAMASTQPTPIQISVEAVETIEGWVPQVRVGDTIVWQGDPINTLVLPEGKSPQSAAYDRAVECFGTAVGHWLDTAR